MPLFHRGISVVVEVQLAGDLGFGISWLVMVLTVSILLATGFFTYVILSTRSRHALLAAPSVRYLLLMMISVCEILKCQHKLWFNTRIFGSSLVV